MSNLPSVAPFAGMLAGLSADLEQGLCCLVECDKGWTPFLFVDLRDRLRAAGVGCVYLDGKPPAGEPTRDDVGVMLTTIAQLRKTVRGAEQRVVLTLPHLDLMAARESGLTSVSREVIPLLYENAEATVLGFQDSTLPLLPVVDKLFERRYRLAQPFRVSTNAEGAEAQTSPTQTPVAPEAPH
jgi:cell division protease FtsH